jgi:uncharacterized protein (TIGR02599 family)
MQDPFSNRSSHDRSPASRSIRRAGFSLVEVMVSMSILAILLLIIAQMISMTQKTWSRSNARISQFREVRFAFDLITRNLSQATLGSYLMDERETPGDPTSPVKRYIRKSDLQFVCGQAEDLVPAGGDKTSGHAVFFQAPLGVIGDPENAGLTNLLCARGYFVQYGSDENFRPPFLSSSGAKNRFRVMEYSPYAENNSIYSAAAGAWFEDAGEEISKSETSVNRGLTRPIADNIILLVLSPRLKSDADDDGDPSIAPNYEYDSSVVANANRSPQYPTDQGSQNLLPPLVRVVMVAIDEVSAERLELAGELEELVPSSFNSAASLDSDLAELEKSLLERRVNYRVFSTTVALNDND